jgi:hypothetical protein
MTLEELTAQFAAAAAPELAKLAGQYAPVAERAVAAGIGTAAGVAVNDFAKLKAYAEKLASTLAEHHAFLAHLIPTLAEHGIALPTDLTALPAAPTLTTAPAAEEQEPAPEATA